MRKSANLPLHEPVNFCHAVGNHRQKMSAEQFHPEKLLAAGPAAKVYRGVEMATGRKVLLKALLHADETPFALDREKLQLLAPMLMQIRHPQIAGLVTLVPTEDEFAIIYDFMPGMNIRAFAAERQTSAADLRALAVQLMHALLVGEQLRQPHGDPKPSNLIIADHPGGGLFVQVQDWALSLTRTAHPPETRWFSAPELHAEARPTSQSDLFTAAASLFCLATNSAPAQGEEAEDLVQQWMAFDAAHVLRHLRPDLDQPLIDWLAWLMRFNPIHRPQSVAQALEMLMPTMHSGFMPMQPPQKAAGTQTTQLISAAHPNAPKPKPVTPKSSQTAPAATSGSNVPAVPEKKSSGSRTLIAVALNLVALTLAGFFCWPFIQETIASWKVTATDSEAPKSIVASPAPAATDKAGKSTTTAAVKAKPATANSSSKSASVKAAPAPTAAGAGVNGRYVRIEIPGVATLNMAEVQVFSGDANIALKGTATQSTMAWDGKPELAIDGITNGDKGAANSVMHTDDKKSNPWWQVDLGRDVPLQTIVIWNRTDKDYGERTTNLTVKVLDAKKKVVWEKKSLPKPDPQLKIAIGE
jgi:serine/threonine protein kinase